ncbi:hypothetical protein ANCDUO_20807 [Ancylostoma duodenale]|uniref:Uncharacterized protein n=1 Tax=Ancylostoma duodenale TaxID=51022 RepID=A0A0C2FR05_9BILA|nr:hypothetical protein ANCDUO_20807 [Ancylostoma duodenale]
MQDGRARRRDRVSCGERAWHRRKPSSAHRRAIEEESRSAPTFIKDIEDQLKSIVRGRKWGVIKKICIN